MSLRLPTEGVDPLILAKRERSRKASNAYWNRNREKCLQKQRDRRNTDPLFYENNKVSCHKWYEANKEHVIAKTRKWQEDNYERYSEINRQWKKANPDKTRVITANWKKKNPERVRANHSKRRRRIKEGSCDSSLIISEHLKRAKNVCYWCGKRLYGNAWHADHIIALANGGEHTTANIVKSCIHCNLSKGTKHPNDLDQLEQLVLL